MGIGPYKYGGSGYAVEIMTVFNRTEERQVLHERPLLSLKSSAEGRFCLRNRPRAKPVSPSGLRREGLLREGRLRRHKLHIPRADFSMKSQPSSIPLRFLSHSDPGGGAEWAPDCPSLNCVFGDFLHKQKATRRRHVPLAKTGSPVRRADAPSAPTGAWKIRRSGSFFKSKTGFEYSPPQRALPPFDT